MLLVFTNINTDTVCLKMSDLKTLFKKSRSNHSEEFWKIGPLILANPQTIHMKKYRFIGWKIY